MIQMGDLHLMKLIFQFHTDETAVAVAFTETEKKLT
jgi:hypothetical protein